MACAITAQRDSTVRSGGRCAPVLVGAIVGRGSTGGRRRAWGGGRGRVAARPGNGGGGRGRWPLRLERDAGDEQPARHHHGEDQADFQQDRLVVWPHPAPPHVAHRRAPAPKARSVRRLYQATAGGSGCPSRVAAPRRSAAMTRPGVTPDAGPRRPVPVSRWPYGTRSTPQTAPYACHSASITKRHVAASFGAGKVPLLAWPGIGPALARYVARSRHWLPASGTLVYWLATAARRSQKPVGRRSGAVVKALSS